MTGGSSDINYGKHLPCEQYIVSPFEPFCLYGILIKEYYIIDSFKIANITVIKLLTTKQKHGTRTRLDDYRILFYGNLLLNFATPFLILMRNDSKRKVGIIAFAAIVCFFGHWWDLFQMIKPGVLHTAHEALSHAAEHGAEAAHGNGHGFTAGFTIPGLLEIGTMLGFLGGFLWYTLSRLQKAALTPENDPYLEESLHHHV